MSLFQYQIGGILEIAEKITSSTVKVIVDGVDAAYFVPWIQTNENAGGTHTMTMDLFDGTTSYALGAGGVTWKGKAFTAYQSVTFNEGILVPKGWQLRVASSDAAGKIDVVGVVTRRQTTA